ncbi:unnamed protein product, partial [Polarella glacialis]
VELEREALRAEERQTAELRIRLHATRQDLAATIAHRHEVAAKEQQIRDMNAPVVHSSVQHGEHLWASTISRPRVGQGPAEAKKAAAPAAGGIFAAQRRYDGVDF